MDKVKIKRHPVYADWVTLTQVNRENSTVDDIHIHQKDLGATIAKLKALKQ